MKTFIFNQTPANRFIPKRKKAAALHIWIEVALLCLAICPVPTVLAQDVTPLRASEYEEMTFQQKLNAQVPLDLTFRDETGRRVRLNDYFGEKPVLLSLVYYECPMLCTLILNGMVDALNRIPFNIGNDFNVVTVSFDHEETHVLAAAKKRAYLEQYQKEGGEQGWHFLVSEKEPISRLAEAVGFQYKYDPATDEYSHRSGIILLTPDGKVSRYFPGAQYEPTDIRLGLVEASQHKIGSFVDKLFLLCYHYDPTVGKYGIVITRIINIGCGITILVLGLALFVMLRRERAVRRPVEANV